MAARVVNNQLKNLRDLFARLFPRANQIDRVLNDANVDAAQVDLNGSALDQWNNVFVFTEFQRQTQQLIEVALRLFPGNEQLRLASEGALREIRGPELPSPPPPSSETLERLTAGKNTLLPIHFLRRGVEIAKSVARIVLQDGGSGTGWLLPDNWMVTNNHVLATAQQAASAIAEFNFEKDLNGLDVARTEFRFDPGAGFHTSSLAQGGDDWTAVKMQGDANAAFGAILLADVPVAKDEYVNIIQHAGGGPKMIALYHNTVIEFPARRIRYLTDTEPGSSGSPVFNSHWQVVALHHASAQGVDPATEKPIISNQGIPISVLLEGLRQKGVCPPAGGR